MEGRASDSFSGNEVVRKLVREEAVFDISVWRCVGGGSACAELLGHKQSVSRDVQVKMARRVGEHVFRAMSMHSV